MESERARFVQLMMKEFLNGDEQNSLGGIFPPEQQKELERRLMSKFDEFLFPSWFLTMFNTGISGEGQTVIDSSKSFSGAKIEDLEESMVFACANCMNPIEMKAELYSCDVCITERPILNRTTFCKQCYEKGQTCRAHGMNNGKYTLNKNGIGKVIPELLGRDLRIAIHRVPISECDCGNGKCTGQSKIVEIN